MPTDHLCCFVVPKKHNSTSQKHTNKTNTQSYTMNILAISLVLTMLTTVVWSPSHDQVIVNKGHRVVMVEYHKEPEGSTKVLISPQNVVPSPDQQPAKGTTFSGPKDLACKCKNKIANVFGITKDAVTDKGQEMKDHATGAVNEAVEKPGDAKDTFSERLSKKLPMHSFGEFLVKAKDGVTRGLIGEAKKVAGNTKAIVKDGMSKHFDIIDSPKRMAEDISTNVSGEVREGVENAKKQAKETVKNVKEVLGERSWNDVVNWLKEVRYDVNHVIWYFLCFDKVGWVAGLVHMVGFSTAYGICVWVTFVSSYILGRCLPRQVFGMVQSRIYPVYFRAMGYCVCGALLGHLVGEKSEVLGSKIGMFQSLSLVFALLMILTNMMLLEPKATKAMYKRLKLEKEEGRGVGAAFAAKDVMVDGGSATVVRSAANGRGVRIAVAAKDGMVDGYGGATMMRSALNGRGDKVANGRGDAGRSTVVKSVAVERQDLLRLNERLKRLNAYSSALNLFTLVALTWHMAYMGHRLQAIHSK